MTTADHESRDPDVAMEFEHTPSSPGRARRAVGPLISGEGDPIAFAVNSVISELVTNVIRHTLSGGSVRAWDPKPNLPFHLEVSDNDRTLPVMRSESEQPGGFGMRMVRDLSDAWGVDVTESGKTVWADFNRPA